MIITLSTLLILSLGVILFMQMPMFGKQASGNRLSIIKVSPNYKNGEFQNISPTSMLSEDASYWSMTKEYFFKKVKEPESNLPTKKTNLLKLDPSENILVWMGHSSYFMQLDGKTILVDPVLSGSASPLWFSIEAFAGSDIYNPDDLPTIDYLFITHDHWDHMDYKTLGQLQSKIKKVICPLGNGSHLEHWGFHKSVIFEEDWNKTLLFDNNFTVHITPARHFSGRGFKRNQTLWASFVLCTPSAKVFIGGDGGYDTHFAEIGNKYGPFDLAILENGQYDKSWKYIHMMPHEVLKATSDLKAKALLPVHSGKFTLGNHNWDEPLNKITQNQAKNSFRILTPQIGEQVNLNDSTQQFTQWWKEIK